MNSSSGSFGSHSDTCLKIISNIFSIFGTVLFINLNLILPGSQTLGVVWIRDGPLFLPSLIEL